MDLVEEFLQKDDGTKGVGNSPSEWQLSQLEKILNQYSASSICEQIFRVYSPDKHNRHLVALIFNMLIWHSAEHEKAVLTYFNNAALTNDKKTIGVIISRQLEWFPFGSPEKTLKAISASKAEHPESKEDYDYWETQSELEMKKQTFHG